MAANDRAVIGLDVSTKAGLCVLWASGGHITTRLEYPYPARNPGLMPPARVRFARWERYLEQLRVRLNNVRPELVVVEHYAFATVGSITKLVELGTLMRYVSLQLGFPVLEVPPASLKKYITGRGNAKKTDIAVALYKRWKVEFDDDDQADAYALAKLGAAYLGIEEPPTVDAAKVLDKLRANA